MTEFFNLLIAYQINTLLFIRIKQISKSRSAEAAIQICFLKYVFLGKELKSMKNP